MLGAVLICVLVQILVALNAASVLRARPRDLAHARVASADAAANARPELGASRACPGANATVHFLHHTSVAIEFCVVYC